MAFTRRTPTTSTLTLIALVLATGVFSFRAFDVFSQGRPAVPTGSALERQLTGLLEPVAGPGNIRVAVKAGPTPSVLILVNGPRRPAPGSHPMQGDIHTIVASALPDTSGADDVTITQLPFARGVGSNIAPADLGELLGLGLLIGLLSVLIARPAEASVTAAEPVPAQREDRAASLRLVKATTARLESPDLTSAGQLASHDPAATAGLIRRWMALPTRHEP